MKSRFAVRCVAPALIVLAIGAGAARADDLSALAGRYAIGTGTNVAFSVAASVGPGISGRFTGFSGTIDFDPVHAERSSVTFDVNAASVTTGIALLDGVLRSDAAFNADAYPVISFRSTAVQRTGPASADIEGLMTLRGQTVPERFSVNLTGHGGDSAEFRVTGTLMRTAFGMTAGFPAFSDKVVLNLSVDGRRLSGARQDGARQG